MDLKIVLRAAQEFRWDHCRKKYVFGYFCSHSRNASSVFGIYLRLLFILDLIDVCVSPTCVMLISARFLESLWLLLFPQSCPVIVNGSEQVKSFLVSISLGSTFVVSLIVCPVFSLQLSLPVLCLVWALYLLPGPLWSPSSHLFPFDFPTQSTAGGQLTPFARCFSCAKPWAVDVTYVISNVSVTLAMVLLLPLFSLGGSKKVLMCSHQL